LKGDTYVFAKKYVSHGQLSRFAFPIRMALRHHIPSLARPDDPMECASVAGVALYVA